MFDKHIASRDVDKEPIMVGDLVDISLTAKVTDITSDGFYWVRLSHTHYLRLTRSEIKLLKQEVRSDR